MTITEKVEQCLDSIRPALAMHHGNIELVGVDEQRGVVKVKFLGGCHGCPMSQITLKMGVEAEVLQNVPEINEVQAVGIDDEDTETHECCGGKDGAHDKDCCTNNEDALFKELIGDEVKDS